MLRRSIAMLVVLAVLGTACESQTITPQPSAGPSTLPAPSPSADTIEPFPPYDVDRGPDGGELVVGDWQRPVAFNPFYSSGRSAEASVNSATWAKLMVISNNFRYRPDLAIDIPTLSNGGVSVPGQGRDAMTVRWTLQPGLMWSDGEPLTCDDFRFAWEWVLNLENAGVDASGYAPIRDWECASPTDMVLHYSRVFEAYLTSLDAPLPRHYLANIPMAEQTTGAGFRPDELSDVPVSGAFKFKTVSSAELRLVRNDNYLSAARRRPAHLEALTFRWYGDPDLLIAAFAAGDVDVAVGLGIADAPKLANLPDEDVTSTNGFGLELLRPNWSMAEDDSGLGGCSHNPLVHDRGAGCPMADPALREAISVAIDRDAINRHVFGGNVEVANAGISPAAWFYAEHPPTRFDPDHAREVLEASGWKDVDGDGIRERNGLRAEIEICGIENHAREAIVELVVDWLADVGIQAIPALFNPTDFYDGPERERPCSTRWSNFDLSIEAYAGSIEPLAAYFRYHSSQFGPLGRNDARVSDPRIDVALDRVRESVDFVETKRAMEEFQQLYAEQTVEVPLYYQKDVVLSAPSVGNVRPGAAPIVPTWNVVDWFVKD